MGDGLWVSSAFSLSFAGLKVRQLFDAKIASHLAVRSRANPGNCKRHGCHKSDIAKNPPDGIHLFS
jgi:hypothetical protein